MDDAFDVLHADVAINDGRESRERFAGKVKRDRRAGREVHGVQTVDGADDFARVRREP